MTSSPSPGSADGEHLSPPAEKPKVIYILGSGRSGSTILGVTLGNCEDTFFAGELNSWLGRSGTPPVGGTERTRFWNAVRDRLADASDMFGPETNRCVERSSAVFRVDRWPARRRMLRRYRQIAVDLYRAVADVADARYIVDSSHFPLRARELQAVDGIELYLLFLFRDPQGVVASNVRHMNRHAVAERRMRIIATNAELWLTHVLALLVFLRQPPERRMFLHYEDFIANPEGVLRDILDRVGSSVPIPDLSALATGIPLVGNKLLRSDVVALKSEHAARSRFSLLTTVLQLPLVALLSRLQPVATASSAHERPPASEPV